MDTNSCFIFCFYPCCSFSVRVGNNNAKGIHLRDGVQRKFIDFNVNIEPVYFNDKEVGKLSIETLILST